MKLANNEVESELQQAFIRGELQRLAKFAYWCAAQTADPKMPESYRNALELAHQRTLAGYDSVRFALEADKMRASLPIAATVIGLKRGSPGAMRLLAIAAALDTGPLTAALHASRNHRKYEALRKEQVRDVSGSKNVIVHIEHSRPVTEEVAHPTATESECERQQLAFWMSNP